MEVSAGYNMAVNSLWHSFLCNNSYCHRQDCPMYLLVIYNYHVFQMETVQSRVHKSLKVWSLYADLEESFGTFKVC